MAVGAVMRQPDRDPRASQRSERFAPFLLYQWDCGPVSAPPSGAFPIAPSAASQAQSIPTTSS